jgi:hypothetical protein
VSSKENEISNNVLLCLKFKNFKYGVLGFLGFGGFGVGGEVVRQVVKAGPGRE